MPFAVPGWLGAWFEIYGTYETIACQLAAAILVVGSYVLAEHLKVRRPARPAPPRRAVRTPRPSARPDARYRRRRGRREGAGARAAQRRQAPVEGPALVRPAPAEGARRQGDGPRLERRRAQGRAVPVRRVVPASRNADDLATHLTGFLREVEEPTAPIYVAMRMGGSRAGRAALGRAAATGVKHMAHRFIVGETPKAAMGDLRELWKDGVASSVDLLGEATVTQAEAQRYAQRCSEALETVVRESSKWPARPQLEGDSAGPLPAPTCP